MHLGGFDGCWFAIQVWAQKEQQAGCLLGMKGYEVLVPTRKVSQAREKKVALFPGYIFCQYSAKVSNPIMTTPGVIRIVGHGNTPIPVQNSEIETLKIILHSGFRSGPHPFLRIGEPVLIKEGPLRGASGTLMSFKKGGRLIVSIHLLRRSVFVEVGEGSLALVNRPAATVAKLVINATPASA